MLQAVLDEQELRQLSAKKKQKASKGTGTSKAKTAALSAAAKKAARAAAAAKKERREQEQLKAKMAEFVASSSKARPTKPVNYDERDPLEAAAARIGASAAAGYRAPKADWLQGNLKTEDSESVGKGGSGWNHGAADALIEDDEGGRSPAAWMDNCPLPRVTPAALFKLTSFLLQLTSGRAWKAGTLSRRRRLTMTSPRPPTTGAITSRITTAREAAAEAEAVAVPAMVALPVVVVVVVAASARAPVSLGVKQAHQYHALQPLRPAPLALAAACFARAPAASPTLLLTSRRPHGARRRPASGSGSSAARPRSGSSRKSGLTAPRPAARAPIRLRGRGRSGSQRPLRARHCARGCCWSSLRGCARARARRRTSAA